MRAPAFFDPDALRVAEFEALCAQRLDPSDVPHAARVVQNVPIYDMDALRRALEDAVSRRTLMAEWAWVFGASAGAMVLRAACPEHAVIDRVTAHFETIIADQRARDGAQGDHFAATGANDRIWNVLQKLCFADPDAFLRYHGNPVLDAVAEAWLGPCYQMTAQVNLVRPGGAAQEAHRDYHLGFQTAEVAARFPVHAHDVSAALTLQGAIAHCDMPVESGPTQLLPFSQLYGPGYLAYRYPAFRAIFADRAVQLSLLKGDALFFNPALFHAAGQNRSADIRRMANLLQISSPFGRALEAVDRTEMCRRLYPALQTLCDDGDLSEAEAHAAIAAAAEGYPFPTNLDTDPPVGGLSPESQAALMRRALADGMSPDDLTAELDRQARRRVA